MVIYHATTSNFSEGQVIVATWPARHYQSAVAALELVRPPALASRDVCVFASESAAFAARFLMGQGVDPSSMNLYEVQIPDGVRAPFAVVHQLESRIKMGRPAATLTGEYWAPSASWNHYEIFGACMQIVRQVTLPSDVSIYAAGISYGFDSDRASRFP